MRIMYDSTTPWEIPRDAEMVAYYVDGRYAWPQAWLDLFPNAVKVSISAIGTRTAMVGDVELGCIWPVADAVPWVLRARADGYDPTIYVNELNDWGPCREAFRRAGIPEPHWWVARYNGVQVVPAGAVARQFAHPHDGDGVADKPWETGKHYDKSIVVDFWPGVDGEVEDVTPEQIEKFWRFPMGPINPETGERDPAFMFLEQSKYAAKTTEDKVDTLTEIVERIADAVGALVERVSVIETGGVSEERIGAIAVDAVNKELSD